MTNTESEKPPSAAPPTIALPCVLCTSGDADPVWTTPDRTSAVRGLYTVVRCRGCAFLFQRPRVRDEHLAECYPPSYPRHQEPSPRMPLRGSVARVRAVRHALATGLGYAVFDEPAPSLTTRLRARLLLRRLRWDCLPWVGEGRYLDVGCGSGATLGTARALGWRVAGIEMNEAAAARARRFTEELHTGDLLAARIDSGRFDVVTAFHVLEHVPDPVAALRRMLGWLSPAGLLIVEVPNAGGLGARLFGRAWSALELPRHLSHFSPESVARAVGLAGGRIVWCWHRAQPRHYLWSLRIALEDHGWQRLSRFVRAPAVCGAITILLELVLPLISHARLGEVIRVGIVPAASTFASVTPAEAGPRHQGSLRVGSAVLRQREPGGTTARARANPTVAIR